MASLSENKPIRKKKIMGENLLEKKKAKKPRF